METPIVPHEYRSGPYTIGKPILEVRNVNQRFGSKIVLRDVNFTISDIIRPGIVQGQISSLLGKSGKGKTTLAKIIAGLRKPTSGQVLLLNGDIKPVKPGEVGFVFQDYLCFNNYTVSKNLRLAAYQGMCKRQAGFEGFRSWGKRSETWILEQKILTEKVDQILDIFEDPKAKKSSGELDLRGCLDQYPQSLSGGQRQRLAILMQILCSSRFIILDEPFSGQDPEKKERIGTALIKVAQLEEYETLIIITHDIDCAVWVSDTLLILGEENDIPGSTVFKPIDLAAKNLAWQDVSICRTQDFAEMVSYLKYDVFPTI